MIKYFVAQGRTIRNSVDISQYEFQLTWNVRQHYKNEYNVVMDCKVEAVWHWP